MKRLQGFVAGVLVALLIVPLTAVATNELNRTIQVVENRMVFSVNGKRIDVPNFVVGGVTYVPIRAAAEALGKTVGWDGGIGISIDDPIPVEPAAPVQTAPPTQAPTQPPVAAPECSVAPTHIPLPVVTETAAQRVTELLAWLKNAKLFSKNADLPVDILSKRAYYGVTNSAKTQHHNTDEGRKAQPMKQTHDKDGRITTARSEKLKGAITEAKTSPRKLSEKLGLHKNTVYKYINNPGVTPMDVADRIASLLKLTPRTMTEIFIPETFTLHVMQNYYKKKPE